MTVRISLNPKYEPLRNFVENIPEIFDNEGSEIYHLRNVIKIISTPDGRKVNVKRYHIPHCVNRVVYSLGIRKPKGQRAFNYAPILLKKGINTPEPIALIEERNGMGLIGYSYFVSEQIEWGHTFYEFGNARKGEYEEAAEALGLFAADMHEKEILHKDFTPGNILWKKDDGGYHLAVVDINRMHFGKVGIKEGLLNLRKFWGPKAFTEILVRKYAKCRGINADEALAIVMPARRRFWTQYMRRHDVPFRLEI